MVLLPRSPFSNDVARRFRRSVYDLVLIFQTECLSFFFFRSRRRLLEETQRLRKALKAARKGEERAEQCETDLAKSEVSLQEISNAATICFGEVVLLHTSQPCSARVPTWALLE